VCLRMDMPMNPTEKNSETCNSFLTALFNSLCVRLRKHSLIGSILVRPLTKPPFSARVVSLGIQRKTGLSGNTP